MISFSFGPMLHPSNVQVYLAPAGGGAPATQLVIAGTVVEVHADFARDVLDLKVAAEGQTS